MSDPKSDSTEQKANGAAAADGAGNAPSGRSGASGKPNVDAAVATIAPIVEARLSELTTDGTPRREVARQVKDIVSEIQQRGRVKLNLLEARDVVTILINQMIGPEPEKPAAAGGAAGDSGPVSADANGSNGSDGGAAAQGKLTVTGDTSGGGSTINPCAAAVANPCAAAQEKSTVETALLRIQPMLLERMDVTAATSLSRAELARQIGEIVQEICEEQRIRLNHTEQRDLVTMLINDMLGLGPLEALLADEAISDILVNGPNQVYIERRGKLELSNIRFRDNAQLLNICSRIVTAVGRRVDESSPLVDARLMDGSRVNIIIPPLAIDGASISIRKFSKQSITLDIMAKNNNISPSMATVLKVAARSRLNILISGGTGSGKTTLLNAMSQLIDHGERIVTIEDAAELQLQQPHVVRLETRPANLEGQGEINMRDLLKNTLRMRPDRIILGEVRGSEAVDMLQAMNTGHDGSMCTVHANRPREALTRLENMVGLAGINLSPRAVRTQIAAAVDIVLQVSRMRDGVRRVTSIMEIVGMEEDVITTQELFNFEFQGEDAAGQLTGIFKSNGLRPHFAVKAEYYGLDRILLEAI